MGYIALMGSDEDRTLLIVEKNKHIHLKCFHKYKGSLVKEMGDGILASFDSPVESIRCAIEIHDLISQDKTYQLRIGIHLGDVLFKDSDIY